MASICCHPKWKLWAYCYFGYFYHEHTGILILTNTVILVTKKNFFDHTDILLFLIMYILLFWPQTILLYCCIFILYCHFDRRLFQCTSVILFMFYNVILLFCKYYGVLPFCYIYRVLSFCYSLNILVVSFCWYYRALSFCFLFGLLLFCHISNNIIISFYEMFSFCHFCTCCILLCWLFHWLFYCMHHF